MGSKAEAYKKNERKSWDAFSRRYSKVALPEFRPYGRRLIQLAQVEKGMWVLDVATGPGEPALTVARRLGPNGMVVGVDFAPAMLRIAAARARAQGSHNVQFRKMDAEQLVFPDLTFDRVLCRFGLMLMPNAERVIAEMHRVLVPGGRVAVAVWSTQRKVNTLGTVREALLRYHAFRPPPGAPDFFRLGKAGTLERALKEAGFRRVRSERMTVEWMFPGRDEFWNSMKQGPSLRRALSMVPASTRQSIKALVFRRLKRFECDGKLRIPNEAVLAIGEK
jgi:ubiquinone/menaquinone biosynthesis C-methylase UbiE